MRLREEWWITGRGEDIMEGFDAWRRQSDREGIEESREADIGSNSEPKGGTDHATDDPSSDPAGSDDSAS